MRLVLRLHHVIVRGIAKRRIIKEAEAKIKYQLPVREHHQNLFSYWETAGSGNSYHISCHCLCESIQQTFLIHDYKYHIIRFLTGSEIYNMYQEKHPLQSNRNPIFGL